MGGPPRALLVLVLAGCDAVLKLQEVTPPPPPDATDAFIDFDSDGDHVLDGSDNCPAVANEDQTDDDRDGIGNACDPHPGARDVVVSSDLFHSPTGTWLPFGAWTMTDGAWTSPGATAGGSLAYASPQTLTQPAIQIGFTMLVFDDLAGMPENLELQLDAGADYGNCDFRHDLAGSHEYEIVLHSQTGTPYTSIQVPPYALGTRYVGTYVRNAPTSRCTVQGLTGMRGDDATQFSTTPVIKLAHLQVRFDSIVVYQLAP